MLNALYAVARRRPSVYHSSVRHKFHKYQSINQSKTFEVRIMKYSPYGSPSL